MRLLTDDFTRWTGCARRHHDGTFFLTARRASGILQQRLNTSGLKSRLRNFLKTGEKIPGESQVSPASRSEARCYF
ncbi:hypothetical protein [Pantoea dispersa]|uniref:hypothetical protein n=1 Tax=Pantoea dispersa TaxID=59814 RepID=UPI001CA73DFB|nr:hypothetical protein [Pantoea dispersa]QZY94256.1 hypothetical protein K7X52_16260 [Pantoea dispersa]